jgi:hypothetical protein
MSRLLSENKGFWKCATCGIEKVPTAHQRRQKDCSYACMAISYKKRLLGKNNPNFKNASIKTCAYCGLEYNSYVKTRKFCSQSCYTSLKTKDKIKHEPKPKVRHTKLCRSCGVEFFCAPSIRKTTCSKACKIELINLKKNFKNCCQCGEKFSLFKSQNNKKYCSYKCHLDSGGAFRAGIASTEARLKYGPKKDANHNEIFEELRRYCAVYDLSSAGCGLPDGLAWISNQWILFDVKNPKTAYGKRGLNSVQKKWLSQWKGGPVYLIYTTEEAKKFANGEFDGIKFDRPDDDLRKKK